MKVGDKVRTRFKIRGRKRRGIITRIDGAYIYVRLNDKSQIWPMELYASELEHYK